MVTIKRCVGIWKNEWLPYSETFIRDQIDSLDRWRPFTLGFRNIPDSLVKADVAPFGDGFIDRYVRRILGVRSKMDLYMSALESNSVDLIHAHFGSGGVNVLPLVQSLDLPLITTFHGADTNFYNSSVPGVEWSYRQGLRRVFSYADRLVTASEYLAERLVDSGAPPNKIEVLYTGTKIRDVIVSPFKHGVIFVGRLIDIKGCADLLEAFALIPKNLTANMPLTIVGDGPLRGQLEDQAKARGIAARFLGRLSSEEVAHEMAAHAIFCGPSRVSSRGTREGFGMVFVEAAIQECAVVGYASGGVSEAVVHEETGLLAREGDVVGLSELLRVLIESPKLSTAMGRRGRARAIEKFDISVQVSKLELIYDSF